MCVSQHTPLLCACVVLSAHVACVRCKNRCRCCMALQMMWNIQECFQYMPIMERVLAGSPALHQQLCARMADFSEGRVTGEPIAVELALPCQSGRCTKIRVSFCAAKPTPHSKTISPALVIEHLFHCSGSDMLSHLTRHFQVLANVPSIVTTFSIEGKVLLQNQASVAYMGNLAVGWPTAGARACKPKDMPNVLATLFAGSEGLLDEVLERVVEDGEHWVGQMEVPASLAAIIAPRYAHLLPARPMLLSPAPSAARSGALLPSAANSNPPSTTMARRDLLGEGLAGQDAGAGPSPHRLASVSHSQVALGAGAGAGLLSFATTPTPTPAALNASASGPVTLGLQRSLTTAFGAGAGSSVHGGLLSPLAGSQAATSARGFGAGGGALAGDPSLGVFGPGELRTGSMTMGSAGGSGSRRPVGRQTSRRVMSLLQTQVRCMHACAAWCAAQQQQLSLEAPPGQAMHMWCGGT